MLSDDCYVLLAANLLSLNFSTFVLITINVNIKLVSYLGGTENRDSTAKQGTRQKHVHIREETVGPAQHHDKPEERGVHEKLATPASCPTPPRNPVLLV